MATVLPVTTDAETSPGTEGKVGATPRHPPKQVSLRPTATIIPVEWGAGVVAAESSTQDAEVPRGEGCDKKSSC